MNKIDVVPKCLQATPDVEAAASRVTCLSPKIHNCHRERLAIVYVRQSQPQPVVNHRESRAVVQQVLHALEPAGLEVSLSAANNIERERGKLLQHWQQRLERARYEADRAARQYEAVEPENRLVARTLEKRWEESLRKQRELEEEYDRYRQTTPPQLSQDERDQLREMAADLPRLWEAEGTTVEDRKDLIRAIVERVTVAPQQTTEFVDVTIH
jgi:hypothetical protein